MRSLPIIRVSLSIAVGLALVIANQEQGLSAAAVVPPDPVVKLRKDKSIPGVTAAPQPRRHDQAQDHVVRGAPRVRWPATGVAEAVVPAHDPWARMLNGGAVSARAAVGDLPVWVAPTAGSRSPVTVRVEMVGRRGDALEFKVRGAGQGRVRLWVDYSAFRDTFGGDWASRLRLTTGRTVLPTRNNGSGQLSAEVPVGTRDQTFAVAAGASGGGGNFQKSELNEGAARWSIGGSSGDFEWSLPMEVPPSIGGPQPTVQLQYSSGAVDGMTSGTNNQSSLIGQGFQLGAGGAIERRYKSCARDKGGNNGTRETGDFCWVEDNADISLNGKSGALIRDDAAGVWRMRGDDGSVIERFTDTGTGNGDGNGEYWRMTARDGTRYYFGLNRLPGWVAGRQETKSAWTVPVFGNHTNEPCNTSSFSTSWCYQAYRWNLDYVVDRHGNTMSYFYGTETDNYARNLTATTVSSYTRNGWIDRIEYGQRDGQVYTEQAVAKVLFSTAERCTPNPCGPTQPSTYPDTPWDLHCASTTNCNNHFTPTFWTQKRLQKVTTQVWRANSSSFQDVMSWTMRQDYLRADNTSPALWLEAINPAGHAGPKPIQMPETNFDGIPIDNRVDTSSDMIPPMQWFRVSAVHYGTGGEVAVTYAPLECTSTNLPPPDSNDRRCRPQKWTPDAGAERQDWFHKVVVDTVTEADRTTTTNASVPVTTKVQYLGRPAWRYEDIDGVTDVANATWSQWRGYEKVRVVKGIDGETKSTMDTLYFRGMDEDRTASGPPKDVKLTDSTGVQTDDTNEFAGQVREQIRYDAAAQVVDKNITDHWRSPATATQVRSWGTLQSFKYAQKKLSQWQATDSGMLQTAALHTYDAAGRLLSEHRMNDVNTSTDDSCARYEYVENPAKGLLELPAREYIVSTGCDQPWSPSDLISDERLYYDNATSYTTPPQRGVTTKGERLAGIDAAGNPAYETVFTATFDAAGRQTSATNALQQTVKRTFNPPTGPLTSVVETLPNSQQTTTEYEPAWGERIAVTGPDGRRASAQLDALGRTEKVWHPGHTSSGPPDVEYEYLLRGDGPSVVTTKNRVDADTVDVTYELYDGLQRLRQTQEPSPAGGRLVTDHVYDSRGHKIQLNGPYYNDAPPATEFLLVDPAVVPKQEVTEWDAADRPTAQIVRSLGTEKWRILHNVNATRQITDPPTGQTPTARILDARGRLVELRQYHGESASGTYDKTTYTYWPAGQLKSLTDPAGNVWNYEYDARGRKVKEDDPDKGITTFTYNSVDQLVTSTDARGVTLTYGYDNVGRRITQHRGAVKQVEWVYDTLAKGKPTSVTRFRGADAYTTAVTGYDTAGRPTGTRITLPASEGRLAGSYTISQTYNDDAEVATRTVPAVGDLPAETLRYDYNDQGLPTTLGSELGSYVRSTTYTPFDETESMVLGTNSGRWVQQRYEYDLSTRRVARVLTDRESLPRRISDTTYGYDPAGNITSITDKPSASSGQPTDTQCFTYDYLRRLTAAWTPASNNCATAPATAADLGGPAPYWHSWTFDKTGNRKSETRVSTAGTRTDTYTYGSSKPHALTSVVTNGVTAKTFTYDATGNVKTRNGESLSWDDEGHLASTTNTSFVYDGEGNRLLRKDPSGTRLYLGETEVHLATDGTLTGTRYYTFDDAVVAVRAKGKLSWLLSDLHGTPTIAIDEANQTVQRRRTTPYGELRGSAPPDWPGQRDFAKGTADPSTGLVHLGAREYDPGTGRFISVDPEINHEDPQQLNGYAYALNNPVSFEDSDGRAAVVLVPVAAVVVVIFLIVVIMFFLLVEIVKLVIKVLVTIVEAVWDFLCWLWRQVTRTVEETRTVLREVRKWIEHRITELVIQVQVVIKWIRKVINQVRPPRNTKKPDVVRPKPGQPGPRQPNPPPRQPQPPKRPDGPKSPKSKNDSRGGAKERLKDQREQKRQRMEEFRRRLDEQLGRPKREDWKAETRQPNKDDGGPGKWPDGTPKTRPNYDSSDFGSMSGSGLGWKIFLGGSLIVAAVKIYQWFEKLGFP